MRGTRGSRRVEAASPKLAKREHDPERQFVAEVLRGWNEYLAMGRPSKSRHIFFRWRRGICLEVPARLGAGHASISSRVEFAELLATIRSDFRNSRINSWTPALRRSDVIFGVTV